MLGRLTMEFKNHNVAKSAGKYHRASCLLQVLFSLSLASIRKCVGLHLVVLYTRLAPHPRYQNKFVCFIFYGRYEMLLTDQYNASVQI